jgi:hypothetical protein
MASRFLLSPEHRGRLATDLDVRAFESLLAALPEELRAQVLACAFKPEHRSESTSPSSQGAASRSARIPLDLSDLHFDDPALQALLDAALAPRSNRPKGG